MDILYNLSNFAYILRWQFLGISGYFAGVKWGFQAKYAFYLVEK